MGKEGQGKKHHGVHYKVFDWHKPGRGAQVKSFHGITCQGCGAVTLHDNDHRGKDNHVMKCCGKKKCRFEAKGGVFSHGWDLRDDVSHIVLALLVKNSTRDRYGFKSQREVSKGIGPRCRICKKQWRMVACATRTVV